MTIKSYFVFALNRQFCGPFSLRACASSKSSTQLSCSVFLSAADSLHEAMAISYSIVVPYLLFAMWQRTQRFVDLYRILKHLHGKFVFSPVYFVLIACLFCPHSMSILYTSHVYFVLLACLFCSHCVSILYPLQVYFVPRACLFCTH